jgi:hypothetical protein
MAEGGSFVAGAAGLGAGEDGFFAAHRSGERGRRQQEEAECSVASRFQ